MNPHRKDLTSAFSGKILQSRQHQLSPVGGSREPAVEGAGWRRLPVQNPILQLRERKRRNLWVSLYTNNPRMCQSSRACTSFAKFSMYVNWNDVGGVQLSSSSQQCMSVCQGDTRQSSGESTFLERQPPSDFSGQVCEAFSWLTDLGGPSPGGPR